jgi:hypothetical protein
MGCDWSTLLTQNRCKAIGVAWTSEELKAIYELKIPPDYVRDGCLTIEDFKKRKGEVEKEKPLRYWNKPELLAKAKEQGIQISDEDEITRAELINLLTAK